MYYKQNQTTIFGVRQKEGHEILLDENSTISSVPMNLNLYENLDFMKTTLKAQGDMMSRLDPSLAKTYDLILQDDNMIQQVQEQLSTSFKGYLDTQLPVKKLIHSGVYVIPINKENLESNLVLQVAPESTLLDRAQNYVAFSGIFTAGSLQNTIMDQEHGIASFKASVEIENAQIDGKKTNATLNNVGFIVAGQERAILVILIYLDVDDLSTWETLQVIKDSLRFTR